MQNLIVVCNSSQIGGSETMCSIIANHFSESIFYNVIFLSFEDGPIVSRLSNKVQKIILPPNSLTAKVRSLAKLFFDLQGKTVVISSVTGTNFLIALAVFRYYIFSIFLHLKAPDLRFLCFEVNPFYSRSRSPLIFCRSYLKLLFTSICAHNVIAISKQIYTELCQLIPFAFYKFKQVGCPVFSSNQTYRFNSNLPVLTTLSGENVSLSNNDYIVSVGRHHPQKDHLLLLHCYSSMKRRGFDLPLIIFGQPSRSITSKLFETISYLGIEKNVFFIPPVDNLSIVLFNASFMLHTASWEGLGNSLIECLSVGTPVVAANCAGGIKDYLYTGINGLLLEGRDPDSLADQIMSNLQTINRLQPIAVSESVSAYSIEHICNELSALFYATQQCSS